MSNDNGVVGDIKIKQPKKRYKKNKESSSSLGVKIFVWFMFIAMLASFIVPLVFYFISVISAS